ncbi:hypothetical protein CBL_00670 [Carabus blaptoides fortunei]
MSRFKKTLNRFSTCLDGTNYDLEIFTSLVCVACETHVSSCQPLSCTRKDKDGTTCSNHLYNGTLQLTPSERFSLCLNPKSVVRTNTPPPTQRNMSLRRNHRQMPFIRTAHVVWDMAADGRRRHARLEGRGASETEMARISAEIVRYVN